MLVEDEQLVRSLALEHDALAVFTVRADGMIDRGSVAVLPDRSAAQMRSIGNAISELRYRPAMLRDKPVAQQAIERVFASHFSQTYGSNPVLNPRQRVISQIRTLLAAGTRDTDYQLILTAALEAFIRA